MCLCSTQKPIKSSSYIAFSTATSALWTILKYGLFDDAASEPATYKTLRRLDSLKRYNNWIWERVAPYVDEDAMTVWIPSL